MNDREKLIEKVARRLRSVSVGDSNNYINFTKKEISKYRELGSPERVDVPSNKRVIGTSLALGIPMAAIGAIAGTTRASKALGATGFGLAGSSLMYGLGKMLQRDAVRENNRFDAIPHKLRKKIEEYNRQFDGLPLEDTIYNPNAWY